MKEGEHATVTNGVGLKAQMKAFSLGGHADDGEHKASQGSQYEQHGIALCALGSGVAKRPAKANTFGVSKGLFYLHPSGVDGHDFLRR